MDILFIKELTIMAIIGIYDWEQKRLQKLVLDLDIGLDHQYNIYNNNITNYLNYDDIVQTVLSFVKYNRFKLIEQVAEEISDLLINKFKLSWIRIKVSKPGAIPQSLNVGVIIERSKIQKN